MRQHLLDNRAFYRKTLSIALPIIVQNGITNFVSLLDNIMVGQIGTAQMSGVSIVNQLLFVFNLCIFGATSGAGIFTAQYFGSGDQKGVRYTFRFKVIAGLLLTAFGISVFLLAGEPLISLYLKGEGNPQDAIYSLQYGKKYLLVMLWGLPAFSLTNAYAGTLRESNQTMVPMIAGIVAVLTNLGLNYVLIFGRFGFSAMGVQGAALATVISRYVELAIVAGWVHLNSEKNPFICGAFRSLHIPGRLLKQIMLKGMPLLINEALWSVGIATQSQIYSTISLNVVAAQNISNTLYNLGSVVFLSLGNVVAIIMGQMLGANRPKEEIRDANRKLITIDVLSCLLFGGIVIALSGVFPKLYNTEPAIRQLATSLIIISACFMPFNAYAHATYFTLRAGGKTITTFLFDSCFVWVICIPVIYCLSRFTNLSILPIFAICHCLELIKCLIGSLMLHSGSWIRNITN